MASRITRMREQLERALSPTQLDIIDESAQHVGHAHATGGGHFKVIVRAACFRGKPLIAQHRLVYQALADLLSTEIHALSIDARPPQENDNTTEK